MFQTRLRLLGVGKLHPVDVNWDIFLRGEISPSFLCTVIGQSLYKDYCACGLIVNRLKLRFPTRANLDSMNRERPDSHHYSVLRSKSSDGSC